MIKSSSVLKDRSLQMTPVDGDYPTSPDTPADDRVQLLEIVVQDDFAKPRSLSFTDRLTSLRTLVDFDLLHESLISLLFSIFGLISAGIILDKIQHVDVFIEISELIILVPVLLNLKGNLELNLTARLSTASNLGQLDDPETKFPLLFGNVVMVQIQGIVVGFVAGIFSFFLGLVFHNKENSIQETLVTISASMYTASIASLLLSSFMCFVYVFTVFQLLSQRDSVLVARRNAINPDNIMAPLAASFGDLMSLLTLTGVAIILHQCDISFIVVSILFLALLLPFAVNYVYHNPHVKQLLFTGWVPLFASMFITSLSGLLLERFIGMYPGIAFISPNLNGIAGNLGAIYTSRITTSLFSGQVEDHHKTVSTLSIINFPIQILFLAVMSVLSQGHVILSPAFIFGYMIISYIVLFCVLSLTRWMCKYLWERKHNPHHYVLPYMTSCGDFTGTMLLILLFIGLKNVT